MITAEEWDGGKWGYFEEFCLEVKVKGSSVKIGVKWPAEGNSRECRNTIYEIKTSVKQTFVFVSFAIGQGRRPTFYALVVIHQFKKSPICAVGLSSTVCMGLTEDLHRC